MSREETIDIARSILARAGFDVSSPIRLRSICFNFAARRNDTLVIIKVLGNIDAFTRHNADELKTIAESLSGSPLVIGETMGSGPLEDGIVYTRFKIPIISAKTLADHLLEEIPPYIFAAPGGLYVKLDGQALRTIRSTQNISLGTLADVAGVSRRTIQLYETGMGAMIDAALSLEEYLHADLIESIDPFTHGADERKTEDDAKKTDISTLQTQFPPGTPLDHMSTIGYAITPLVKSPFDAVSMDKGHGIVVLTGIDAKNTKLVDRAVAASELASVSGKPAVIIVQNRKNDSIAGTALVSDDELRRIDDTSVLNDLIFSRSCHK